MMITTGFQKPPSIFKGSGLYQLHLVKADVVRPFIPAQFRIVEALGYTLGGFGLSSYKDSPYGPFDELVTLAGMVSHRGSSVAWTGKALVSSDRVCEWSRKDFGIATEVANFSKKIKEMPSHLHEAKSGGFLNFNGAGKSCNLPMNYEDIQISEINDSCNNISIKTAAAAAPELNLSRFINSPPIKLSFTSLSGLTEYNPHLLQYTCNFETRVRVAATAKVSNQYASDNGDLDSLQLQDIHQMEPSNMRNLMIKIIMQSKPIVAFEFNSMKMIVDSPRVVF